MFSSSFCAAQVLARNNEFAERRHVVICYEIYVEVLRPQPLLQFRLLKSVKPVLVHPARDWKFHQPHWCSPITTFEKTLCKRCGENTCFAFQNIAPAAGATIASVVAFSRSRHMLATARFITELLTLGE